MNWKIKQQIPDSLDGLAFWLGSESSLFSSSFTPSVAWSVSITAPRQLKVTRQLINNTNIHKTKTILHFDHTQTLTWWPPPPPLLSFCQLLCPQPPYLKHFLSSEDDSEGKEVLSYWVTSSVTNDDKEKTLQPSKTSVHAFIRREM